MGAKCLAQEQNAVPRPGLELGTSDPEYSALTIRPPRLLKVFMFYFFSFYSYKLVQHQKHSMMCFESDFVFVISNFSFILKTVLDF